MNLYRFTLQVQSAFGTPLVGDSLFGQCCWAIANRFGATRLTALLEGYCQQHPFMVISDAMPAGYLPLPTLPSFYWEKEQHSDRKKLKKKKWLKIEHLQQQSEHWQKLAQSEQDIHFTQTACLQPHNSINRATHTTGKAGFAPYSASQIWYSPHTKLEVYILLDENRFPITECKQILTDIGSTGFGRDASIGLGKFDVLQHEAYTFKTHDKHNAYLTLANCAPQHLHLEKAHCYYQITTRFGRHGDRAAIGQNPFKKPIILAKKAAIFTPKDWKVRSFLGNGLTDISYAQSDSVHQGYAPVIPLMIDFTRLG
ncbi:type III-A CRISPR-associated RAMP protein Csm4 [Pasteurella multocida]|uniref:type III-A CRISPR-associated RAMP protein Csm4 n=1 Tax=Pasteurella multocida TaxID=747 RepID=UPI00201FCEDC|nr:CRISPR-associated protein Csm4 [Pasteurella multocida]MCL7818040.1 CRISPR-associated protein Csm4 [Pasteurella multocida]MEB3457897.1 CRISPR-associated protein Csm4 [Pasteurella multocida]MEB3488322.1 CRISPR-associated protein Csm4 [Pasteurella multocida]MEB3490689.1 CRISPR-associated protein Csm4 [Pasteurella multocida]HDR0612027.1 CRISPR-associated protein Csm4 [Pasteurella multocida]